MAVGEMAQENADHSELEISLSRAIQLRASYINRQSDQLTLSSVRRLLERDLGLRDLFLEQHKAVVKGLVDEVLNKIDKGVDDQDTVSEKPKKRRKQNSRVIEELQDEELEARPVDGNSIKNANVLQKVDPDVEKPTETSVDVSEDENNLTQNVGEIDAEMPDRSVNVVEKPAPVDEVVFEKEGVVQEGLANAGKQIAEKGGDAVEAPAKRSEEIIEEDPLQDTQEPSQPVKIDESTIKLALSRRADELKSNSQSLTVTTVRHLLEDDLGLGRDELKVHKQFIRTLVDELLAGPNDEPTLDQSKGGTETEEEPHVSSKGKKEAKFPVGKNTHVEEIEDSEEKLQGNGEVSDSVSEDRRPNKVRKRKKKDTELKAKTMVDKKSTDVKRPFSARVERLREILKFVGIGVSPAVYKKAKQAPEHERDEVLIRELESKLTQEGLSPNPTEKEMKKVKARLEKKRDLDGIDNSNIVEEPRRSRGAANSWFTPRPNRYAQVADKNAADQDSDDDAKPAVTGAMDD